VTTRLLVVDDHPGFLAAAAAVCSATPNVELRGTATNAADALELARCVRPDLVLVDLRLADDDGAALADQLRAELPRCVVVLCSTLAGQDLPARAKTGLHLCKEKLTISTLAALAAGAAA
jgi:DNA-binding NarL/FixJ family response regulator